MTAKQRNHHDRVNQKFPIRGETMSMRGQLISEEYNKMVFVRDDNGGEYVCYSNDLNSPDHVSESEKEKCLDTSQILGPNW